MGPIRVCRKTFKGWGVDLIRVRVETLWVWGAPFGWAFGAEGRLLGLGVGGVFRGVLCARMGRGGGMVRGW